MSRLEAALASLVARLSERRARFALVGGLAVSVRTEPRYVHRLEEGAREPLGQESRQRARLDTT